MASAVALPAGKGPAFFDYIAYEPANDRVWIPNARDVGSVDVYDVAAGTFTRIGGWKTAEQDRNGKKRTLGPSAASVGDGFIYIGNRATSEVCPVAAKTLRLGPCLKLATPIDGVAYVASAKEVWVTAPHDQSLAILDASQPGLLKVKQTIKLEGAPEGYAVDEARGLFYTNLEDKNRSLVIDVHTHEVKATWSAGCGADGPRGVALDSTRDHLFVACTDGVRTLDAAHGGKQLAALAIGAGVDNIDYLPSQQRLYVGAGKAASFSVVRVDETGRLTTIASVATADRARNAVADANGNAYLVDPQVPRLLIFRAIDRAVE
jgi:DNA-binding beta-propeller fold protein YncE